MAFGLVTSMVTREEREEGGNVRKEKGRSAEAYMVKISGRTSMKSQL